MFAGFRALDASGDTVGGGLIGGWICSSSSTAYTLTLTGPDATVVQIRFQRVLDNFACSG